MHDFRSLTRRHVCLVHIGGREIEYAIDTTGTVVHHIPRIIQIRDQAFALHVQNILVVVDVSGFGGDFQPFVDGMDLAHTLEVHHQHAGLEVVIRIAHVQLLAHVFGSFSVFHIEIADKVDIGHGGDRIVSKFDIEQFGGIAIDHQITIQIQQLRIERQRLLDDEAIIRFDADMRVAGGEIEASQITAHIEKANHGIRELLEKLTHGPLVLIGDIPLQHNHII